MSLSEFFIRKPVFTIVLILLLVITGLLGLKKLPIRYLPAINQSVINIITEYDGASPQLIEKEITDPVENAVSGISGLESLQSNSKLGKSYVTLVFKLGVDANEAANDIRNKMSALQRKLPAGSGAPSVRKNDADADPLIIIGFSDKTRNALEITDYISRYIKPEFEKIPDAGEVQIYGERQYAVKIAADPIKLAAQKISVSDISKALVQQNIDIPSGQIESKNRFYTVVAQARLKDAKHFANLVLSNKKNHIVHLSDVAKVDIGNENENSILRINGKPGIGLAIIPNATANPLELANHIKKTLAALSPALPENLKPSIVFDASLFIKQSMYQVLKTFVEAMFFVALVVFLFLGNFRFAIIPIVTIPICLIASIWPMQWLGFDLNVLTLLAMVLAIGLVVDDAIVVLENCHRHMKLGKSAFEAAIDGSREILFAIIAMTITLAAVYAPVCFIEGFTGKLFLQFGVTLSITVIISGLVALSLSPMMCSRVMKPSSNRYSQWLERCFEKTAQAYRQSLEWIFDRRGFAVLAVLVLSLLSFYGYRQIKAELAPEEDQSYIVSPIASPTNASTEYTDHYAKQVERLYDKLPEKTNYFMYVKPSGGYSFVNLQPWEKRTRSQQAIASAMSEQMKDIVGVNVFPVHPSPLGRSQSNSHFRIALLGHVSYKQLDSISKQISKALAQVPELKQSRTDLALDNEQINLIIDRERAASLEVSLADIAELISTMLGGQSPIQFNFQGQSYKVIIQLDKHLRTDIAILNTLYVQSARNKMIPLSSLIDIERQTGPETMPHLNRLRTASISAELQPGAHMDKAIRHSETILRQQLPENIQYEFTDGVKDYIESSGSSYFAFILSLVFIYLVLAAQFESFRDPLIVLSAVPFCLAAALLSLWLFQGSMNIYTNLGMITLIGLIAKHGIMITEFANQLRKQGIEKRKAIIQSAAVRLRPILMTSSAMILGALPLILASGAGSESRKQLGMVMIGGLGLGTFLAIYVIPAAYLLLSPRSVCQRKKT